MNKNILLFILLALSIFWTLSMFIAPLTLPANSIQNLDGYANRIDYGDKWDTLPAYQKAIYYFGDWNCHQKADRSFSLNGNQIPVDARLTSIFLFLNLGFITAIFTKPSSSISQGILNFFPENFRNYIHNHFNVTIFILIFFILLILPVAFDGFYQMITSYESTNVKRFFTGIPTGWVGGFFIGVMITSFGELKKEILQSGKN